MMEKIASTLAHITNIKLDYAEIIDNHINI